MRILGIDPGSLHSGFAVLEKRGGALVLLDCGRISGKRSEPVPRRLARMARGAGRLVERWQPDLAVLESLFHGRNTRSLIVLAQARGALLAELAGRGLEPREYSPAEIKSAVTGNGRAGKEQVARMVGMMLGLDPADLSADATDAVAVALCGVRRFRLDRLREAPGESSEKPVEPPDRSPESPGK